MTTVLFDAPLHRSLFITLVNSDLTEGRGHAVVHSVHLDNDHAERAAHGSDVQGTDGEVREVPFNVGKAGLDIWNTDVAKKRYGYLLSRIQEAIGVRYGDRELLPEFGGSEWAEYEELAKTAGRNPLAEKFAERRATLQKFTTDTGQARKLFAVLSDDARPKLVAVIDTERDAKRAALSFAQASNRHPELRGYTLRELYTGVTGDMRWGEKLEVPGADNLTSKVLGFHADGTVFFVPDTLDEYVVRDGVLYTMDGDEADLLALKRSGIRVRTAEDIRDIAYAKMENLLEDAPLRD